MIRIQFICCAVLLVLSSLLPAQTSSSAQTSKKPDWTTKVAEVAPDPADVHARAVRKTRSSAFDDRTGTKQPLDADSTDNSQSYGMSVYHVKLPPFPISDSQVVLVGQITTFQPFLSNDKATIYTELQLRIERVLRDSEVVLPGLTSITIPQLGGVLHLPSGKIVRQFVPPDENLLDVGARHLLFLNYDRKHDWFGIVKAWELQNGRAKAHAQTDVNDAGQGISKYDGMDESVFLQEVQNAVNKAQTL